jgi:hypothetical protein
VHREPHDGIEHRAGHHQQLGPCGHRRSAELVLHRRTLLGHDRGTHERVRRACQPSHHSRALGDEDTVALLDASPPFGVAQRPVPIEAMVVRIGDRHPTHWPIVAEPLDPRAVRDHIL